MPHNELNSPAPSDSFASCVSIAEPPQPVNRISAIAEQEPAPPPKELKIAIVGKAPASQQAAPYGDESWEIWTLSNTPFEVPRFTRHFELHQIAPRIEKWGPYWKFIKGELKCNGRSTKDHPLYIQKPHPELPHATVFPADAVTDAFGRYINNTVSWLIGYAMLQEGVTDIGLWGIDMAQHGAGLKSEYAHQRPSCEFFLGVAAGKGIHVHIPATSDLLKCRQVYGYNTNDDFLVKCQARTKELRDQLMKAEQEASQYQQKANELKQRGLVLRGALDDQDWVTEYHH